MEIESIAETAGNKIVEKITELSGEDVLSCLGCGKCGACCSEDIRFEMDLAPYLILHLAAQKETRRILTSKTIWLCVSCSACLSRCPQKIDIPKIMEALRTILLRANKDFLDVKTIPADLLSELPPQALVASFRKFTG